jgi:hypothetical protein
MVEYIYYLTAAGNSISSISIPCQDNRYGTEKAGGIYGPSITYKITPAGSLFSSQPGGLSCWTSPLAFGLIGILLPHILWFQLSCQAQLPSSSSPPLLYCYVHVPVPLTSQYAFIPVLSITNTFRVGTTSTLHSVTGPDPDKIRIPDQDQIRIPDQDKIRIPDPDKIRILDPGRPTTWSPKI